MKTLTHDEAEALRQAPKDGPGRTEAALRLLDAYERLRDQYAHAGDLECHLDEAIAGRPLYFDDEDDEPDLASETAIKLKTA